MRYRGGVSLDHKLAQMCHQVQETVSLALAAANDPALHDLTVIGVEPTRGAAALRIVLTADGDDIDYDDLEERLARAGGWLRREVTREINRRRAPTLDLVLLRHAPGSAAP